MGKQRLEAELDSDQTFDGRLRSGFDKDRPKDEHPRQSPGSRDLADGIRSRGQPRCDGLFQGRAAGGLRGQVVAQGPFVASHRNDVVHGVVVVPCFAGNRATVSVLLVDRIVRQPLTAHRLLELEPGRSGHRRDPFPGLSDLAPDQGNRVDLKFLASHRSLLGLEEPPEPLKLVILEFLEDPHDAFRLSLSQLGKPNPP